jgi:predicted alpha/beta superfamily hydrolase
VTSRILKETRQLLVYTPPSYRDTTYLPREYPVLYLLDGDAHFHSVTGLLQILGTGVNGTFAVPEMIVVAIPNTDRMRDMSPTHVTTGFDGKPSPAYKTTGGMPAFLQFIRTELIPHVDSTYRTMPYRVFVGHSLGGITTIQALYTMPEVFNAYVAIDPSLWWDNSTMLREAKPRLSAPGLAGRALYLAQANTINAADTTSNPHFNAMLRFNAIAEAHNASGLRYAYRYYPQDDHGSVPLIAEYDALRFIFAGYKASLAQALEHPAYITEHFARVSRELGVRFTPPESMVDLLAMIQSGQDKDKAVGLYRLNTELHPASPKAWAGLGGALMATGDSARAIAAVERALTLKPGYAAAAELRGKLRAGR